MKRFSYLACAVVALLASFCAPVLADCSGGRCVRPVVAVGHATGKAVSATGQAVKAANPLKRVRVAVAAILGR